LSENLKHWAVVPDAIWNGTTVTKGKALIIEGERIVELVDSRSVGKMRSVNLPDCTLIPGLIDAHVHLSNWMMPGFLAAGVTTVRDTGNNLEWVLNARERTRKNPLAGPTIKCCGPVLDGRTTNWPKISRQNNDCNQVIRSVEELVSAGVDAIKLYVNLDKDQMDAAITTAHNLDKFVLAHLGGVNAIDASKIKVDEIEHLTGCVHHEHGGESPFVDPEYLSACIDSFLENQTIMCPTLMVWDRLCRINESVLINDNRLRWVHPQVRSAWARFPHRYLDPEVRLKRQQSLITMKRAVYEMWRRGCEIITGTDTPWPYVIPGFGLHDELALIVDSGIAPIEALKMATSRAAAALGLTGEVGVIAPGAIADLVGIGGDPTEDILHLSNVQFVCHRGEVVLGDQLVGLRDAEFAIDPQDAITEMILGVADTKQLPKSPPVIFTDES